MSNGSHICSHWRAAVAAALSCVVLIGCGGGGGGSSEVEPSPSVAAPVAPVFAGNWRLFVTVEGVQTDTGVITPGDKVPTAETVSQLTVANFSGALVEVPVAGYVVTVDGNRITVTGPNTNFTVTVNSFSVSNYQSCGACGVGSEVSLQLNVNMTEGGVFDGNVEPTTTTSGSGVLKWVRLN